MPHLAITSCLVLFVATVAIVDSHTRKIPNVLTAPAAILAVLLHVAIAGPTAAVTAITGLLVGLGVFLPAYLMKGFGAGDVKAMAATGAFLGPKGVILASAFTLVAGAVVGFAWLTAHGGFPAVRELARRWALRVLIFRVTRVRPNVPTPRSDAASRRFPYGIAIACGTMLSLAWS